LAEITLFEKQKMKKSHLSQKFELSKKVDKLEATLEKSNNS
jgi:hypothetical protein